jgi:hypothetical protein
MTTLKKSIFVHGMYACLIWRFVPLFSVQIQDFFQWTDSQFKKFLRLSDELKKVQTNAYPV